MTLDELFTEVCAELRAIGHGEDLAGLDACPDGYARAGVLYNASSSVRTAGRQLFLRFAGAFTSNALRCTAEVATADAEVWRERAEAELDRYREPAPELQPYVTSPGGIS
ncbi:hypothetical protein [Sorangium sp. So ce233]|uniref:hypothetical protein n=1 Tax=Sorangium sp. So ce233 TaxID=3133290 RepID=UPI003F648D29